MYQAVLNELGQDVTINITSLEDLKLHLLKKNKLRLDEISVLEQENLNLHKIQNKLRSRISKTDMEIIDMQMSTSALQQKLEICTEDINLANVYNTEDKHFESLFDMKNNQTTVKTNLMFVDQIFQIKTERLQMQQALVKLQVHSPQNTHYIDKIQHNLDQSKINYMNLIKKITLHTNDLGTRVHATGRPKNPFHTDIIEDQQKTDANDDYISLLPIPLDKTFPKSDFDKHSSHSTVPNDADTPTASVFPHIHPPPPPPPGGNGGPPLSPSPPPPRGGNGGPPPPRHLLLHRVEMVDHPRHCHLLLLQAEKVDHPRHWQEVRSCKILEQIRSNLVQKHIQNFLPIPLQSRHSFLERQYFSNSLIENSNMFLRNFARI